MVSDRSADDLTGLLEAGEPIDALSRARLLADVERGLFGRDDGPPAVGRYRIVERLGGGGQGVVYVAHDPRLDRRVAVKLLRSDSRDRPDAHRRLLREASALAQLSHPNVVAVNDVGECPEGIFVVTELVDGVTLASWMKELTRTWREILEVFLQAGHGLVAAHAHGIVHRDFKPANVLVGDDGRVRLLDFGLARAAGTKDEPVPTGEDAGATSASESAARSVPASAGEPALPRASSAAPEYVTESGLVMGTPAYMAPEQWQGLGDARVDQFAFGVALFEALYGKRPFRVRGDGSHFARSGVAPAFPQVDENPAWLRRALARALAIEPAARHRDMSALLRALQRGNPRRRRAGWAALGVGIAGVAAAVLPARSDPCEAGRARLRGVWTDAQRTTLRGAFAASGERVASSVAARVDEELDAWAGAWMDAQRRSCEAIFASDGSADDGLDQQMQCLGRGLDAFTALVDVLGTADATAVAHASEAVARLPLVDDCLRVHGNVARLPVPEDPATRARVEEVRRGLAKVVALRDAGQTEAGRAAAEMWLQEARATGFAALEAEALIRLSEALEAVGHYEDAATRTMEAYEMAVSARHDRVRAQAAAMAVFLHGHRLAEMEQASDWVRHAEAALTVIPAADELNVVLPSNAGAAALRAGTPEVALRYFQRAADVCAEHCPEGHLNVAMVHNNMAIALVQIGEPERALTHLTEAQRIWSERLGTDHPHLAIAKSNLAGLLVEVGRLPEALEVGEAALQLNERVHGPAHPQTAAARLNLAAARTRYGEFGQAVEEARHALRIRLSIYGEEHPTVADNYNAIGLALHGEGRHEEALAAFAKSTDVGRRVWGPDSPFLGPSVNNSTRPLLALGRSDEALARAREALEIYTGAIPEQDQRFAYAYTSLGLALAQRGEHVAARDALERALALREAGERDAVMRAETRFALARTLVALGDETEARVLAVRARDELAACGVPGERDRAVVEAWLAEHGGLPPRTTEDPPR